ncbi:hypothetical protein ACFUIT_33455 [Streptomyces sp. NPDC057239]
MRAAARVGHQRTAPAYDAALVAGKAPGGRFAARLARLTAAHR